MRLIYKHKSVMLNQYIENINFINNGLYIDGTFGYGGYTDIILKHLNKNGRIIIIDKDPDSIYMANKKYKNNKQVLIYNMSFSNILNICKKNNLLNKIDGIILDLGISTDQINKISRGFSFQYNGQLDMRMNNYKGLDAKYFINNAKRKTLFNVIKYYGEDKLAGKISDYIVKVRKIHEIKTTLQLSNIICKVYSINNYKTCKHPATKTFQSIRIYINNEVNDLILFLSHVNVVLNKHSKLTILAFNSIEKKIIKNYWKKNKNVILCKKILQPNKEELLNNIYSRSATMYVLNKR